MSTSGLRLLIQSSSGVLLSFTRQDRPERMHVKLRPQEFWQGSMRHKTHGMQYCQHALHITACALHLLKVLDNQYKIRTDASQPIVVRWSKDWLGAWRASRYFKIFHYHWIAEHWAFWRVFAYLCHKVVSIQWCLFQCFFCLPLMTFLFSILPFHSLQTQEPWLSVCKDHAFSERVLFSGAMSFILDSLKSLECPKISGIFRPILSCLVGDQPLSHITHLCRSVHISLHFKPRDIAECLQSVCAG